MALALNLPLILVAFFGTVFLMTRRRSLRDAEVPALLGSLIALLLAIVVPVIRSRLPALLGDASVGTATSVFNEIHIGESVLWAIAFILIYAGIVFGRPKT